VPSKTAVEVGTAHRPLLTFKAALEYTGFEDRYMRRLVAEKRICYHKFLRRGAHPKRTPVFFCQPGLDAFIEAGAVPPIPDIDAPPAPKRGPGRPRKEVA
jgi:hypothetical protein